MGDLSKIPKRNNWKFGNLYDSMNDEYSMSDLINYYLSYMTSKCLMMFKWNNLPDGMNSFDVEKFLQLKGNNFVLYDESKKRFFVLEGSAYDNISWNYEPTKSIIVNPALPELNKIKYKLGENAVMIRNDYLMLGLYTINEKNAIDVANTDVSLRYASFNTRFKTLFTSDDDDTKDSINKLIEDIWKGVKPSAIVTNDLYKKSVEGIEYSKNNTNEIIQLIELKQYQLANWYIELCINANYNMKRESLNENETNMNQDALLPFINQMLECRKMACDEMNKLFGLDVSVELSSSWKKINDEVKESLKQMKLDTEGLKAEIENLKKANEEPKADDISEGDEGGDGDDKNENE